MLIDFDRVLNMLVCLKLLGFTDNNTAECV